MSKKEGKVQEGKVQEEMVTGCGIGYEKNGWKRKTQEIYGKRKIEDEAKAIKKTT